MQHQLIAFTLTLRLTKIGKVQRMVASWICRRLRNTSSVDDMLGDFCDCLWWFVEIGPFCFSYIVALCLFEKDKYLIPAHSLKATFSPYCAKYCRRQAYSVALKNSFFFPRYWNSISPSVANKTTEEFSVALIWPKSQPNVFVLILKLALPGVDFSRVTSDTR